MLYKDFPQGASEWPKDKVLDFLVYLIKREFLATFSFDPWQFSCPLGKIFVEYLIWKLLQSETKAIGQELIYEAKLQNSALPGRP